MKKKISFQFSYNGLQEPIDIAIDKEYGHYLIADSGLSCVFVFDSLGKLLFQVSLQNSTLIFLLQRFQFIFYFRFLKMIKFYKFNLTLNRWGKKAVRKAVSISYLPYVSDRTVRL